MAVEHGLRPNSTSPLMVSSSRLKLAPFGANISRGMTPTVGEGSIAQLDWAQQIRIARAAERRDSRRSSLLGGIGVTGTARSGFGRATTSFRGQRVSPPRLSVSRCSRRSMCRSCTH